MDDRTRQESNTDRQRDLETDGGTDESSQTPLVTEFSDLTDATRRMYGPAPFWWWDGDELSTERITDQLETLSERGVTGVCFEQKYPHGPPEGPQVEYFSEEWWTYMEHAVEECARLGMRIWIHDETYHHSPPSWKRYWQSRVETEAADDPELRGQVLDCVRERVTGPTSVALELPPSFEPASTGAYPIRDDTVDLDGRRELTVEGEIAFTEIPEGEWLIAAVGTRPQGVCRTSRAAVDQIIEWHYEAYERRLGEHFGDAIAGTFQDELFILHGSTPTDGGHPSENGEGVPYDERLRARFESNHGYDPEECLIGLYENIGSETERFRCQFYDVVTTMLEENWFRPLYEWHEARDIALAHDNWGRNDLCRQTTEYGDYYRTMRWFQVPGYDDGGRFDNVGERNFFDAKLAASIATCYDRDRVWGELFHTTGWGFPTEQQLAGVIENYCYGCTLYNMHGLYYGSLGGWYEHAPPDTHFRQPYWQHTDDLYDAVTRLSNLFSRGSPVFDAALLYPAASMHACWRPGEGISETGEAIDEGTRELAASLYRGGLDHLIVDADSLVNADLDGSVLNVADTELSALVLGPNVVIEREVADIAARFYENGGVVLSVGSLATSSVEGGRDDDLLERSLERLFGSGFRGETSETLLRSNDAGGTAIRIDQDPAEGLDDDLLGVIDRTLDRDIRLRDSRADSSTVDVEERDLVHTHRRINDCDYYLLLNTADESRTIDVSLHSTGQPELWDPLSGGIDLIHEYDCDGSYTSLELSFGPHEFRLLSIDSTDTAGNEAARVVESTLSEIDAVVDTDAGFEVRGRTKTSGTQSVTVDSDGHRSTGTGTEIDVPDPIEIDGPWEFELEPVLDNRYGDLRYPPSDSLLGPEVRRFRYRIEGPSEDGLKAEWYATDAGVAAILGDIADPDGSVPADVASGSGRSGIVVDAEIGADSVDAVAMKIDADGWSTLQWGYGQHFWIATTDACPEVTPEEDSDDWIPYAFSTAVGKPNTHPDDHGLNGVVSDDFLRSPASDGSNHFWTTVRAGNGGTFDCHYGAGIEQLLIDGEKIDGLSSDGGTVPVSLPEGSSAISLTVESGVDTHLAFDGSEGDTQKDMDHIPRLRWFHGDEHLRFDARPDESSIGWYQFVLPVGARSFTLPVTGAIRVWIDGKEAEIEDDRVELESTATEPTVVTMRVDHDPGIYGGDAWTAPVEVETAPVAVELGDWEDLGLSAYSGIGVYRTTIDIPDSIVEDGDDVVLELGAVAVSATVRVNGVSVGTSLARPHRFDVTDAIRPGETEIEVEVANTVANHFAQEVPTRYVYEGQTDSGLFGPVELRVLPATSVAIER